MVKSSVIASPHEAQVLNTVVESVLIFVVDNVPIWDGSVMVFPDFDMLKLESTNGAVFSSSGKSPSKHPVSILLVARWLVFALPFMVGAT
jgi:hypothetical protein